MLTPEHLTEIGELDYHLLPIPTDVATIAMCTKYALIQHITEQAAEIALLKTNAIERNAEACRKIEAQMDRVTALEADRERLDWLNGARWDNSVRYLLRKFIEWDDVRAAIDAAREVPHA